MSGKRKASEEPLDGEKSKAAHTKEGHGPHAPAPPDPDNLEELVFEDPYEDEFEEESYEEEYDEDADMRDADDDDGDAMEDEDEDDEDAKAPRKVWLPGQRLPEGETLEYDSDAYDLIHFLGSEWPCLSFDLLPDTLGQLRTKYPHTLFLVAGTQAETASANKLVVMKLSQLAKTRDADSDSDDGAIVLGDEESSGEDDDPIVEHRDVAHSHGTVNRIRAMPQAPHIVATMADNAHATVYDIRHALQFLGHESARGSKPPHALQTFKGHTREGYALAWNTRDAGRLLTGDCAGKIYAWTPQDGGSRWAVDARPFEGHTDSVEDLQWSPSEGDVFASASVDGTVKLWDARKGRTPAASIAAHTIDVNVLSWNTKRHFLLVTGADNGEFSVWDLRKLGSPAQFSFAWHKRAITSIEWNPNDDSMLAATSEDDSCSIWDLSLANERTEVDGVEIPSQLMFVHQGQQGMKEVHWHRQIPSLLVTTAEDGFCVFKPNNLQ